ncbi:MAG TPA: four helix bundle protein [Gemmatimonadaceae bacterium]|jgi:four helix bundle protein|nr:four helix bundle protein [Gemmatimonadaceae bacterium]
MASSGPIRNHRDLIVWQKAMVLRRGVHLLVAALPREARWEIGRQTERAASAIAPLIAEGHSRPSRQDYRHYLSMARGETGELDTHLRGIAEDYPHVARDSDVALSLVDEISRMLMAMIKKLS